MNWQPLCDLLIAKVKRDYPGDVSLMHVYGSYADDDMHELSDLDIYFVPKTERGYQLSCTFIFNGIGIDFWPLSWERLERIANYEDKTASMITWGETIYFASEEDKLRFQELIHKAKNKDASQSLHDASNKLTKAYEFWFHMDHANSLAEVRACAIEIVYVLSTVLGELNKMPIKRGRKLLKQEILAMPLIPNHFAELYDTAFFEEDARKIKQAYGQLIANTAKLLASVKIEDRESFQEAFQGWYEELIQYYNKIYHACEVGDHSTALFAAVEYSYELEMMLQSVGVSPQLPNLIEAYDPDNLQKLAQVAHEHQEAFEALLAENDVVLRRFSTWEEVKVMLDEL